MSLAAVLTALRFSGVIFGITFLMWALNQVPVPAVLASALGPWPVSMYLMANYFGVTAAIQLTISFILLRITVASIFAVARMF